MINTNPLVSIITICINSAKSIRQTIDSVLNQSYKNIEYIIVDGGSRDDTIAIISEYGNKIARVISESDRGISDAFNKGVRVSTGEYIQFINADDTLNTDKIKNSLKVFNVNPTAGFVFGDIWKVNKSGSVEKIPGDPYYRRSISHVMNRVNHPTMLVKRSLFEQYGYFENHWKIAMDYDWILRITNAGENGIYSSDIIVQTLAGGISDEKRLKAFKECRSISIQHGKSKSFAYTYYLLRIIKHLLLKLFGQR